MNISNDACKIYAGVVFEINENIKLLRGIFVLLGETQKNLEHITMHSFRAQLLVFGWNFVVLLLHTNIYGSIYIYAIFFEEKKKELFFKKLCLLFLYLVKITLKMLRTQQWSNRKKQRRNVHRVLWYTNTLTHTHTFYGVNNKKKI